LRQFIAVILFTLFNLGAFGVTIEQHLCCHSQQEESTTNHCNDDESCCGDTDDCCDEIVSQIKIAKDYNADNHKINLDFSSFLIPATVTVSSVYLAPSLKKNTHYASLFYFPPPENFQIAYSSFLI